MRFLKKWLRAKRRAKKDRKINRQRLKLAEISAKISNYDVNSKLCKVIEGTPRFEFQKTSDSKFVEDTSEKRTEIYQSRVCHIERNGPRSSKRFSRQIRARRWSASSPNDKLEGCLSIREEARFVTHYRPAISILIVIARSFLFEIVLWIIVTIAQQWPDTKDGVSACLIVINARIPSDRKSNTHRRWNIVTTRLWLWIFRAMGAFTAFVRKRLYK